jgi:hypothetical protein
MEAVEMVKRSFCALALVGMLSTAALAGQANFELLWNGHSGQLDDPVPVEPGVLTALSLSLRNNTATGLPIGGVQLNFVANPGVEFDLNGPDDLSPGTLPSPNREAMADDGWQWSGPLGSSVDIDGNADVAYPLLAGGVAEPFGPGVFRTRLYPIFCNDPPQTVYDFTDPTRAIILAGGDTMDLGTLMITANLAPGPGNLVQLGVNNGGLPPEPCQVFDLAGFQYLDVFAANASVVNLAVVPEPATAALLAIGGLLGLRRRRRA